MIKSLHLFLIIYTALALSACAFNGNSHEPLTIQKISADKPTKNLLVMFPGINSPGTDFIDHGFVDLFREHYKNTDILLVDTRLAYITAGNIAYRINNEIIHPAKKLGYNNIWLLGISLGGLSVLEFDKHYPNQVKGIVLIAPYLGSFKAIKALATTSNLQQKQQWADANRDNTNKTIQLWRHILKISRPSAKQSVQLLLAYGKNDRYNKSHQLLASLLTNKHVTTIDGSHGWITWEKIWKVLLNKKIFDF